MFRRLRLARSRAGRGRGIFWREESRGVVWVRCAEREDGR
jgi:hypothetical protein